MENKDEVGCRQCGQGGKWKIFTDGQRVVKAECSNCGHSVEIDKVEIKKEKDGKAYPLWMFT